MAVDALFVSPELESRIRFKQTALSSHLFHSVQLGSTLSEGLQRLANSSNVDVVYLSARFDQSVIKSFLERGKGSKQGEDSSYLVVFSDNRERQKQDVASLIIEGADGFFSEPYSVEELVQATEMAYRIRRDRLSLRQHAAVKMIVESTLDATDRAAALVRAGRIPEIAFKGLREINKTLSHLSPDLIAYYYEVLVDTFIAVPAPVAADLQYSGGSDRVKQRLIKKLSK